ncbi:hypothetical protein [Nocardiopsis tropica]|uniref:Uncharacterized protein n=1 Tax=Nocardiopsis tropica TaxID=109330 RepID=A0ABU7L0A3_9ACTN|nr:hypothetical protein [Nocardiopsis umidischolae]MEE2054674.1 hypothetical protein [Nocardiopsis umidischolae]
MFGFFAIIGFVLAGFLEKKLSYSWSWMVSLGVALISSFLLYASGLSQTAVTWLEVPVGGVASAFSSITGEPLTPMVLMGVITTGAVLVTVFDLWMDHTYNPKARAALIVAPITAHGAGGWVGEFVAGIHGTGADIAMSLTANMFG